MDAKKFYELFTNSWVQTFDDAKLGRRELVTMKLLKDAKYLELKELNDKGAWIFLQPNISETRKWDTISSIDWVYVDMDEGTKLEMMTIIDKSPITPDIIVESKRWYHLYWRVKCTAEQFKLIIDGLITFFGWDIAISSPNEVLRFPWFLHCKDPENKFLIKIVKMDLHPHTPQDFIKSFPSTAQTFVKKFSAENPDDVIRVIKNIDITEVLKHCGVDVRRWVIFEDGKATSASVWKEWNIVKRFSGKEWGGSTIDIVMHHLGKTTAEAIKYLKDYAGIVDETMLEKVTKKKEWAVTDVFAFVKPYTWGTAYLDKTMTPIQRYHFNIFVWETGSGKTAFCFYMAKKNAEQGHKVLFLSLEMTTDDILSRNAREFAWITKEQWREPNNVPSEQKKQYYEERERLSKLPNLTLAWFTKSIEPTCDNIAQLILDGKFDLVFIDNFDLIQDVGEKLKQEEKIAKFFMDFTNRNKIPVIMLHHFKKGNDNKAPRGNDSIRGSSKISHSADNIFVGRRPMVEWDEWDKSEFVVVQIKDRDFGIGGMVKTYYNRGNFQDYPLNTKIWF